MPRTENTLIVQARDIRVYRLSSCEFQIMTPSFTGDKTYVLNFDSLNAGSYTSYEQ